MTDKAVQACAGERESPQLGKHTEHKTRPWRNEEMAFYRGFWVVAHLHEGATYLYFPGGRVLRMSECHGCTPPLKLRSRIATT